jgi:hypothetical protein
MILLATDHRIELARAIEAGKVMDHGWARGHITWNGRVVTGRVAEFRRAELLEPPDTVGVKPPYQVRLNGDGRAWLAEHGGGVS